MWIKNTKPESHPIRRLKNQYTLGNIVKFTDSWTAQVTEDVGESLIEQYEFIEQKDNASDSN